MSTYTYEATLKSSQKSNWKIEDIIGGERVLDFSRPFMPESLARTSELGFLDARLNLGNLLRRSGRLDEAATHLRRAV